MYMCSCFTGTPAPQCGQMFTTGIRLSCVSVARAVTPNRSASAPYNSMMSSGSTPLPFDLLIPSPKPSMIFG